MSAPRFYVHRGMAVLTSGAKCRVLQNGLTERLSLDTNSLVRGQASQQSTHGASGLVLVATFSPSGKRFALSTDCKQLSVYETDSWRRIHEFAVPKKGVVILFSEDDRFVLLADKFGDVYRYALASIPVESEDAGQKAVRGESAGDDCSTGELVLGHLSMILDATFLGGGSYLATCDRDEKIRVTRYPQSYDIQSYCLGHTKMVTRLLALSNADEGSVELLLSGGADGWIRLWDYVSGDQLACVNVAAVLPKRASSGNFTIVNSLHWLAARCTAIVTLEGEQALMAFRVHCTFSSTDRPSICLSGIVELEAVPWCVQTHSDCVLVLQPLAERPLVAFAVELDGKLREPSQSNRLPDEGDALVSWLTVALNNEWPLLSSAVDCGNDFYAKLEKMGVDNLPDYLQKKRERLDAAKEKSDGSTRQQQHEQFRPSLHTEAHDLPDAKETDGSPPSKVCRSSTEAAVC